MEHFTVQTKVRPYAEVVEVGGRRGLQIAAIVYGNTKKEADARAALVATYLKMEGTPRYIRRRLQLITIYHWAHRHKLDLIEWLIACWIEPKLTLQWLNSRLGVNVGVGDATAFTTARVMGEEEAIDDVI